MKRLSRFSYGSRSGSLDSDQIVGGHDVAAMHQYALTSATESAAKTLRQFRPTEHPLDPFSEPFGDCVARIACGVRFERVAI
jgi:hypothetical protein